VPISASLRQGNTSTCVIDVEAMAKRLQRCVRFDWLWDSNSRLSAHKAPFGREAVTQILAFEKNSSKYLPKKGNYQQALLVVQKGRKFYTKLQCTV